MNKACEYLWYDKPAPYWEGALPLGDGFLGAMVFGGEEEERIALNESSVWSGHHFGRLIFVFSWVLIFRDPKSIHDYGGIRI